MDINKKSFLYISLNHLIRSIGFSLVGVFIPIYLLTIGYTLSEVFKYFLVFYVVLFIFSIVSMWISKKRGIKFSFIANIFFLTGYFLLLNQIHTPNNLIYFAGILAGIEGGFYWMPFGSFFMRITEHGKRGTKYGVFMVIGQIAGVIGPILGAILAKYFGFEVLFYSALGLFLISLYPIFMFPNIKLDFKFRLKSLSKIYSGHKHFFWGSILMNIISEVEYIFWPIFIYISLKSFTALGTIVAVISFFTIIFTFILGKLSDKTKKSVFFRIAGLISVVIWISRVYLDSPLFLWIISIVAGFSMLLIEMPFQILTFNKAAKHENPDEFILFKEIPIFLGRFLIFGLVLLFVKQFTIAFIVAGISSLILVLLNLSEE